MRVRSLCVAGSLSAAVTACGAPIPTGSGGTGGSGGQIGTGGSGGSITPGGNDGCSNTQARNLSIREIAAYQSVKIPIAQNGQELPRGSRIADVVQRRSTLFRVFLNLGAGWAPRTLSARLTLNNGAGPEQYYVKRLVTVSSADADASSTFQMLIPPDKIQANTRYSVEMVECEASSGSPIAPRFPISGDVALGARNTGVLRVRIVPVGTNGLLPDTSSSALQIYRDYLMAMYPIDSLDLGVVSGISTAFPVNWSTMLDQLRAKRQTDAPPGDVYYYGLVKPGDTLVQYCSAGCTAGIGYVAGATQAAVRAAVGIAFADNTSAQTMAHEIGHNHGRNHAPCGSGITGVDSAFPYPGALIGTWGYDVRSNNLFDPGVSTDIMGYCSKKWISDYTYRGITDRVATVNGALDVIVPDELVAQWRVELIEGTSSRWGIPFSKPDAAFGDPEQADVLDAQGNVLTRVTVYRTELGDSNAYSVLVPQPGPGWSAIRVAGADPLSYAAPQPSSG